MDIYSNPSIEAVTRLLARCGLPTSDLDSKHFEGFFACGPRAELTGVVGVELYGEVALLRSLAVTESARQSGRGRALVERAERYAWERGALAIYLLTMTAEDYFARRGYRRIERESAPDVIQRTPQFTSVCPSSTALMVKRRESEP